MSHPTEIHDLTPSQIHALAAVARPVALLDLAHAGRSYFHLSPRTVTFRLVRTRKVPVSNCKAGESFYVTRIKRLTPNRRKLLALVAEREGRPTETKVERHTPAR